MKGFIAVGIFTHHYFCHIKNITKWQTYHRRVHTDFYLEEEHLPIIDCSKREQTVKCTLNNHSVESWV